MRSCRVPPSWPDRRAAEPAGDRSRARPAGGLRARDGPDRVLAGRQAIQRNTGHGVRRLPRRARDGHLRRRRVRMAGADRAQSGGGCGTARGLRAHGLAGDLGSGRHHVRSRRADVLRPAVPVAARPALVVHLGARGGRARHRAAPGGPIGHIDAGEPTTGVGSAATRRVAAVPRDGGQVPGRGVAPHARSSARHEQRLATSSVVVAASIVAMVSGRK
jgi:hypothetical protein